MSEKIDIQCDNCFDVLKDKNLSNQPISKGWFSFVGDSDDSSAGVRIFTGMGKGYLSREIADNRFDFCSLKCLCHFMQNQDNFG